MPSVWQVSLRPGSKSVGHSVCPKGLSDLSYALIQAYKGVRHSGDQGYSLELVLLFYELLTSKQRESLMGL